MTIYNLIGLYISFLIIAMAVVMFISLQFFDEVDKLEEDSKK